MIPLGSFLELYDVRLFAACAFTSWPNMSKRRPKDLAGPDHGPSIHACGVSMAKPSLLWDTTLPAGRAKRKGLRRRTSWVSS